MKHIFYFLFLALLPFTMYSQERTYLGMHGLQDEKGDVFFSYQGYSITISKKKGSLKSEKFINGIIKKHELGTIIANYSEDNLTLPNLVIEAECTPKDKPNVKLYSASYLFPLEGDVVEMILFQTLNSRNAFVEQELVKAYFRKELDQYIHIGNEAKSIDFVGRKIELGDLCKWMSPNNVACRGGQISWAEFPTYQEAIVDLQTRIIANENPDIKILQDEDVEIIFENTETLARRIVYISPGDKYPLSVYYVAQEIRGRYVSCTLSNYAYNRNDYELSLLLQKVMSSLRELPEHAISEFDKPQMEESHTLKNYWSRYNIYGASIKTGVWVPIGDASNLYNFAPSVGLTLGIPIKRDMAIDFNISLAFAVGRKYFEYHLDRNYIMDAKTDMLVGLGVSYRYQKVMARNIYFTPYFGAGYHILDTNQIKHEAQNDDENDEYYKIGTLDLFGGVNIRYKRFGAFAEYHYTPYHLSSHAKKDLGNSAINLGIFFVLW